MVRQFRLSPLISNSQDYETGRRERSKSKSRISFSSWAADVRKIETPTFVVVGLAQMRADQALAFEKGDKVLLFSGGYLPHMHLRRCLYFCTGRRPFALSRYLCIGKIDPPAHLTPPAAAKRQKTTLTSISHMKHHGRFVFFCRCAELHFLSPICTSKYICTTSRDGICRLADWRATLSGYGVLSSLDTAGLWGCTTAASRLPSKFDFVCDTKSRPV